MKIYTIIYDGEMKPECFTSEISATNHLLDLGYMTIGSWVFVKQDSIAKIFEMDVIE